jgi:hypothetical protein
MNNYARYQKDAAAFHETDEFKNFMRVKEEAYKMWEEVEARDEWKAWDAASKIDKFRDEEACRLKNAHKHAIDEAEIADRMLHETDQWQAWSKAWNDYVENYPEDRDEKGEKHTEDLDKLNKLEEEMQNVRRLGGRSYFEMSESADDAVWAACRAYEARLHKISEDKKNTEAAFLNSKIWKDWVIKKQELLDADPKRLKLSPDYDAANKAYNSINGSHEVAMTEFYRSIARSATRIGNGGYFELETPYEAFCRREKENSGE